MKLKNHAQVYMRALKIFTSFPKPILLSRTFSAVTQSGLPFINLWFSAQILNELAGAREQSRLLTLVLLTIGINLFAVLAVNLLNRWVIYCDAMNFNLMLFTMAKKLFNMDYIDLENPEIQQRFSTIRQHQSGMGFGLPRVLGTYDGIIHGGIRIIFSLAFTVTLFTLKVPADSALAFLNSPWSVFVILLILGGSVFISPLLSTIGGKIWIQAADVNNRANRFGNFYLWGVGSNSARGYDVRMYNQKPLIDRDIENGFKPGDFLGFAGYAGRFNAAASVVSGISNGLIYLFVALKAFAGAFPVGNIVQYVGAITQFGSGFNTIFNSIGGLLNNTSYLENTLGFLDIPNEKYQGTISVEKRDDNEYALEFKNVSFKYPGSENYALRNLNLKFNIGGQMAVVGMNGSGKTTMIKLLCRLYDPTEGMITLNGVDIKKYKYDEYMQLFSVVFQDFFLLPFPLGQNVAASMNYDAKKAEQTLIMAGFGERLSTLPHGLDTYLYKHFEESGVSISGGESQKIALARALYKDAPLIVLDEPTAALDPVAEYEIYSKFNEIVGEKTAIYISHRLSSCRFCDNIAVFDEGILVQRGSHEELLAVENGKYFELWNAQAQYYVS